MADNSHINETKLKEMKAEELMKPRFEVIADYPSSSHSIGDIYEKIDGLDVWFCKSKKVKTGSYMHLYPHLFRKLQWWEKRELRELPMYLKHGENGRPRKVVKYFSSNSYVEFEHGRQRKLNDKYLPATLEEYTNNNKQP